jgi:hypothetical protein
MKAELVYACVKRWGTAQEVNHCRRKSEGESRVNVREMAFTVALVSDNYNINKYISELKKAKKISVGRIERDSLNPNRRYIRAR